MRIKVNLPNCGGHSTTQADLCIGATHLLGSVCITLYYPTAPLKPAISVSTITLFLIELLEALQRKHGTITKRQFQELTYKLVSKENHVNNNFAIVVNSLYQ